MATRSLVVYQELRIHFSYSILF